jgi:hypothetical protein
MRLVAPGASSPRERGVDRSRRLAVVLLEHVRVGHGGEPPKVTGVGFTFQWGRATFAIPHLALFHRAAHSGRVHRLSAET